MLRAIDVSALMRLRIDLGKVPGALAVAQESALDRQVQEAARVMRDEAPKAFSTLVNSIRMFKTGELERIVRPSVAYAGYVAEGTGPAAGHAKYYPDTQALLPYVRQKIAAGGWKPGRKGSARAISADVELMQAVRATAWSIYMHGTQPDPFDERAADKVQAGIEQQLAQAAQESVARTLGGQA